ncbi:Gfo/Idh/MocA family oxidoreductase [Candidatus Poribacteria bacterium]|nr:Gfo/Idh/MocA family oxidoreductase [Candidatus Poribacteria bacterium]
MQKLNVAVIGAGGHAQGHFAMIKNEPEMRLVAVAEINPERLFRAKEQHQPEFTFTDYREMLDKCDLDIVYVETMPGHLLPIVLDCLARNIHTSIEKSPGMNSAETEQLLSAAKKCQGKAMVSFDRRYKPEVLAVRKLVFERGGAVHCSATYNKPLSRLMLPEWEKIAPTPIICDAIHHVDLLRWLAGSAEEKSADVVEVYAEAWSGDRLGTPRYNAVIKFENGCCGVMMSHYGVGFRIQRAEVHAEDFSAYLDLTGAPKCELYDKEKAYAKSLDLDAVGGPGFNETRHFIECIKEDKTPWSNLEDALKTMKLCEAIERGHKGKLIDG